MAPSVVARQPTLGEYLLLGALTAFGAMTIDLYLPALPAIARDFAVTPAVVQLTLTAFFIGMALGQLVYGPVSDRVGRRPTIIFGCALYVAASIACALAPSIELMVTARFVQALGCCSGMVVVRAVVRDRYDHGESARIFSLLMLVLAVAPLFAPALGSWLVMILDWRAVFYALALFGAALLLMVWARLDESRSAATAATARGEGILASYWDVMGQRRVIGYMLVGAANGATLFAYISTTPDLMIETWGYSAWEFSVVFALIAIGLISAAQVNRWVLLHRTPDWVLGMATLVSLILGVVLLAVVAADASPPVILVAVAAVLASNGFVGSNAMAGALSVDPLRAGTVSGLLGAATFAMGALSSAVAAALHDGTAMPLAITLMAALILAVTSYYGLARPRAGDQSRR
ncbi:multidrug effflux MFS transporter [Polymorphobacter sp.]|uniref:multidrug effflux MFS transporter n=1 Tax=Polymorphobacter sp. TaxID=1909290 RepID=UPI003F712DBB